MRISEYVVTINVNGAEQIRYVRGVNEIVVKQRLRDAAAKQGVSIKIVDCRKK